MVFWICVTLVFGWLVRERLELNRLLRVLTTRVHVFGTRGKTTTTRLLAALFRQNGRTVLGKISGDTPLLIFPDGTEMPLNRRGPANVREYVSCLRRAARSGCDTVVFECMALSPETVVAATGFLKPTHALITNTRPDHHETMGRTPGEIAATLALAARGAERVYTVIDAGFPIVQRCAAAAGAVVTPVADDTGAPQRVSAALVEKIAADLAFQAPPTVPESVHWPEFTGYPLPGGGRFAFLDLLSANDVVSSALLLEHARRQNPEAAGPLVLLLATRADRPLRTVAFVEWLASLSGVAGFVPVGSHALYAHAALRRRRMPLLFRLPPLFPAPSRLLSRISGITGPGFRLVGLGNAHGHGERLRAYLEQEVRPCC